MATNHRRCKADDVEPTSGDWSELSEEQLCDILKSSGRTGDQTDPTLRYAVWRWDVKDQVGLAFVAIIFWLLTHDWWWQLVRK